MNNNLKLNFTKVKNIYEDYQTKLEEIQLSLISTRDEDECKYNAYLNLLQKTKQLILDIRLALSLIQCDDKDTYLKELDEIERQCRVYENNGNKIVNIYNDIFNKNLLLNNCSLNRNALYEINSTKSIFEKIYSELECEYIKIAKYIINNNIKNNELSCNNIDRLF